MDKNKAIEMLKQCLEDIPQLKGLQYDDGKFQLWLDRVKQIIKSGLSQDDFKTFISTNLSIPVIDHLTPPTVRQNYYLKRLDEYGVNIEKIIQKYEILGVEEEPASEKPITEDKPKAFIAHEGMTGALEKVKTFLYALGVSYLIAEIEPSNGRVVEGQVEWTQGQADFAVILATKGKVINKETGKSYMGMNVADELGRAREVFKNRIILLLQRGVEPHTNVSGIVYEPFTPQNMEKALTKIAKELRNWGFIRAGKVEE